MNRRRTVSIAFALLLVSLVALAACSSAPQQKPSRPAAYNYLLILGDSRVPVELFGELYGKNYPSRGQKAFSLTSESEVSTPTGTVVMLYNRENPNFPAYYPKYFPWLSSGEAQKTGLFGTKSNEKVILLVSAANSTELMSMIRSIPSHALTP